ncbi:DUF6204 family protein [Actinosynnema sp. NPDC023587]|uniref:DUF6204 family protein n=1 Tax=Actinosynnema sp. NPDC023587 TaxID=3154695 RepID=UPI0033D0650A
MAEHTYRVMVRGRFTDLDEGGRARLLAAVDRHGVLTNGFSEQGALSYDRALDFFSYRVQFRAEVGDDDRAVRDRGLGLAARAVEEFGVDFRDLRASATDVDLMKVNRPKRRG